MIEKFPFMLRFSKHSESFFNSLSKSERGIYTLNPGTLNF